MLVNRKLQSLREEFQGEGYLPRQIEEIELSDGNGSVSDRVYNLEIEKSYWTN